jgi:hypothetical protein
MTDDPSREQLARRTLDAAVSISTAITATTAAGRLARV